MFGHNAEPAAPLLGRSQEREGFANLRATHRLVTITGPAGTGKTALARAALEGDQTVWVNCAAAADADELAAGLADALGLGYRALSDRDAIWGQARAAMSQKSPPTLVLDGIDRVRPAAAQRVQRAMDDIEGLNVVATGQTRLELPHEGVLSLGGLDDDAALALFERTTAAIRPPLSDDERADARCIVTALMGHPLAIALCAARADVLRIDALRQRVEGLRSAPDAPSGLPLQSAIGFSWELCDDGERQALMDFSIFPGGFSIDGAEAVFTPTSTHGWAVDMVQGLKRKSVLVPYSPDPLSLRFRMPPPLWAFARDRLVEAGRRDAVHQKMSAYFSGDGPWTGGSQVGRRCLAEERENLLDVARHARDGTARAKAALSLARLAHIHGPIRPLRDLVEDVRLTDGKDLDDALSAELLAAEVELAQASGDAQGARELLETVPEAHAHHPALGLARGMVLSLQGQTKAAAETLAEAKAGFAARRDKEREADAAVRLAACAAMSGDLARAEGYTRRTISLTDDPWPVGRAWLNLGTARLDAGRVDAARYALDRAQEHYEQVGAPTGPVVVNLGLAALAQGDGERAEPLLVRAAELAQSAGDARLFVYATCGLALAALFLDRDDEARMMFGEAEVLAAEESDALSGVWAGAYLAVLDEKAGRSDQADARLAAAEAKAAQFSHPAPRLVVDVLQRAVRALRGETVDGPEDVEGGAHVAAAVRVFYKVTARPALAVDDRPALVVGEAGRQVVLPDGTNIDLSRRGPLRLILLALCAAHDQQPPAPLDVPQLIEAGWPGQRIVADAGPARVYAAIRTLRKLGFEEYLFTRDAGYLLAPELKIVGEAA